MSFLSSCGITVKRKPVYDQAMKKTVLITFATDGLCAINFLLLLEQRSFPSLLLGCATYRVSTLINLKIKLTVLHGQFVCDRLKRERAEFILDESLTKGKAVRKFMVDSKVPG